MLDIVWILGLSGEVGFDLHNWPMGESSSDERSHHDKKSKSKHKHKHKFKEDKVKDGEFLRPTKLPRSYSDKKRDHHDDIKHIHIKEEPKESYSPPPRHRLSNPVIIKDESPPRRGRVSSPVILRDDTDVSDAKPNLGRSGLLDKNSAPIAKQKANFELSADLNDSTSNLEDATDITAST
ncbi:unnamed protein product [Trichobilharzia regenti]|nr:unnamed protein product [Trichobilharzia regenti]